MTVGEKLNIVKALISDVNVSDEQINTYLNVAAQRILATAYPCGTSKVEVPSRYETLQCELAVRMIARRGGEGETGHTENGISRSYANADDSDLLSRIVPAVGVCL
nr:MAG TPA: tail connector protein [Caudoviricetes sp.]